MKSIQTFADLRLFARFVVPPHIDIGVAASFKARPRKQDKMGGKGGERNKNFKKTKIFRQGKGGGGGKFTKH